MIALSKTACYAVQALTSLRDQKGQPRFLKDISQAAGIPAPYLAKIIKCLIDHELVHTKRGYRGGIILSRAPEKISLLEVVEAVEGENWIGLCLLGQKGCASWQRCPVHAAWAKIREQIEQTLGALTVADALQAELIAPLNALQTAELPRKRKGNAMPRPALPCHS